jgi:hypothetical protein
MTQGPPRHDAGSGLFPPLFRPMPEDQPGETTYFSLLHRHPVLWHSSVPLAPPDVHTAPTSQSQAPSLLQDWKFPVQSQVPSEQVPAAFPLVQTLLQQTLPTQ